MTKAATLPTIPKTPKTGNPASVFSWLTKHFAATKDTYQGDSNPWASYVHKTGDITDEGRAALVAHVLAHPEVWVADSTPGYYYWADGGVRLYLQASKERAYAKNFSFTSAKKAKAFTTSYYD